MKHAVTFGEHQSVGHVRTGKESKKKTRKIQIIGNIVAMSLNLDVEFS